MPASKYADLHSFEIMAMIPSLGSGPATQVSSHGKQLGQPRRSFPSALLGVPSSPQAELGEISTAVLTSSSVGMISASCNLGNAHTIVLVRLVNSIGRSIRGNSQANQVRCITRYTRVAKTLSLLRHYPWLVR